jgi:hypothetical protein
MRPEMQALDSPDSSSNGSLEQKVAYQDWHIAELYQISAELLQEVKGQAAEEGLRGRKFFPSPEHFLEKYAVWSRPFSFFTLPGHHSSCFMADCDGTHLSHSIPLDLILVFRSQYSNASISLAHGCSTGRAESIAGTSHASNHGVLLQK